MRPVIFSITALLICAAILQLGNGLQFTLVPIRAQAELFSDISIAWVGSGYFAGFLIGCLVGGPLIGRVGHVRVLTAVLAGVCIFALLYPLFINEILWVIARIGTGISLAIAYMSIESWLNERAPNAVRGSVLSLYSLIGMVMLGAGQFLLALYPINSYQLFSIVGILAALAAIPVALTKAPQPVPVPQPRLRMKSLLDVSRVSVAGSIVVGLVNSAFWAFGPIYAIRVGMTVEQISLFMAAALIGGAALMWPMGLISDRVDRRLVAGIACVGGSVSGIGLVMVGGQSLAFTLVFAFIYGSFAFTIHPICMAHANDHTAPDDYVKVSGGLLFLYGASSLFGPFAVAALVESVGTSALFGFTAAIHGLGAIAVFALMRLRAPTPDADKGDFQPTPRTTAAAFQLHKDAAARKGSVRFDNPDLESGD